MNTANPTPLEDAIKLAVAAHSGQLDEGGTPHIVHCLEVMLGVKGVAEARPVEGYTTEELMIAAVLHDAVEDSEGEVTLGDIHERFGGKVGDAVDALTRRHYESYRDFIYRAKAHPAARVLKAVDVMNNRGRTHKISAKKAKWREKLEYKYAIAFDVLDDHEPTWEEDVQDLRLRRRRAAGGRVRGECQREAHQIRAHEGRWHVGRQDDDYAHRGHPVCDRRHGHYVRGGDRMKRYRIKSDIMLSFLTPRDQYDTMIDNGELESDGSTIWLIKPVTNARIASISEAGRRHESITTANAIGLWLQEGKIEEIGNA